LGLPLTHLHRLFKIGAPWRSMQGGGSRVQAEGAGWDGSRGGTPVTGVCGQRGRSSLVSAVAANERLTVIAVLKRDAASARLGRPASTWVLVWRLRNEARTADVGRELDVCVFEFGQRQYCEAALHIARRGTIIVEGPWDASEVPNRLAVTGGTGDFSGVGGIARFEPVDGSGPEKVKVTLVLKT
jgi:hypothetical protein